MSENTRKLLSFLMAAAILFSMVPVGAVAQAETPQTEQVATETVTTEPVQPADSAAAADVLAIGENTFTVATGGQEVSRTFIPEKTGTYVFYSTGEKDTRAYLYDAAGECIADNDDGGEDNNFMIVMELTAGEIYTLGVKYYNDEFTGDIRVMVENPALESLTFAPLSISEFTNGYMTTGWDSESQSNVEYYYYNIYDLLRKATYTATFADGTVLTGSGTGIDTDSTTYAFSFEAEQSYDNAWTAGNTYEIAVSALGQTATFFVTIEESPLESLTFTPVSVIEHTSGYWQGYWDETTQTQQQYFYYYTDNLLYETTYTATFTDGTVLTGTSHYFTYDGVNYSFANFSGQSGENPWTVGNTYELSVQVMGLTATIPVTIVPPPLQSITFTPISVMEKTHGYTAESWDEETESWQEYYCYNVTSLIEESTFNAIFSTGENITGNDHGFYYDDDRYNFAIDSDQSYENQWTAGNTYEITVKVMGQTVTVPVTIEKDPLESLTFTPVSLVEGTGGYYVNFNSEWEYFNYDDFETTYTATFTDGTVLTGTDRSFTYGDREYYIDYSYVQDWDNEWTAGNTYYVTASAGTVVTQLPVTITESPLESLTFTPISVIEKTKGYTQTVWDDEAESWSEYYVYSDLSLLYTSTFTATFSDGTVITDSNDGFEYAGEWYSFRTSAEQSYETPWAVGNTYSLRAAVLGKEVDIPVSIIEPPLESITFTAVSIMEESCGYENSYWDDELQEWKDYFYYELSRVMDEAAFTATFNDGSVQTGTGTFFTYNGETYDFELSAEQNADNPWTVGNTYEITVKVMNRTAKVSVTITPRPTHGPLSLGENSVNVPVANYDMPCTFTPEKSGEYIFYSTGSEDTQAYLYDANGNYITENDDGGEDNNFKVVAKLNAGETYTLKVGYYNDEKTGTIQVVVEKAPLESITFAPVSIMEGSKGWLSTYWDYETQSWQTYYYYDGWNILGDASFTATFTDGTVINGTGSSFNYQGEQYHFSINSNQSGESPWTAGNTYAITVEIMGQTAQVPVIITESPLESITFTPISVIEHTCGDINTWWDDETESEREYYWYYYGDAVDRSTFTATFSDGTVLTGNGGGFEYQDTWYNFSSYAEQGSDNQWTVGNTYNVTVAVMGQIVQVPLTIVPTPLESITFTPVSVMEDTNGYTASYWIDDVQEGEYFIYYTDSLVNKSTYTATFTDGTVLTGSGYGFEYDGQWYSFECSADQSYENPWTAGNTYEITVEALNRTATIPVTVEASPLESITFTPVSVMEGTNGYISEDWDDETQSYLEYHYYYTGNLVYKSTYTATFTDGTVLTGNGTSFTYKDEEYDFSVSSGQSGRNPWTAGNTYEITIEVMGKTAQIPVTVTASPVQSITAEPITMMENKDGSWQWHGDSQYFHYNWNTYLRYTVTFTDGTVVTGDNGGVHYNGEWFNIRTSDNQSGENPWLAGNTYMASASLGGQEFEVYVTICKEIQSDGYTCIIQDGKAVITDCTLEDKVLEIPEAIEDYPVVGITGLGSALDYAEEIYIPDSVTMLSEDFLNPECWYYASIPLKKLCLGSGISALSENALQFAEYLESIEVSAENPYLCSIDGVVYDKDVTTLVAYPPAKTALHTIPDSVTDVHVILDSELVDWGLYMDINFQLGAGVTDYKMVDGILYNKDMTIVIRAMSSATGSYVMPDSVIGVNKFAFAGSKLTSIVLGNGVTEITYCSFLGASNLEELTVPATVKAIHEGSFDECYNLKKVHISDVAAWCDIYFGDNPLRFAHDLYLNGEKIVDLVIPETVTGNVYRANQINGNAFWGGSFETVSIPSRITFIGYNAFADCTDLTKVYITDLATWSESYFSNERANPLSYARNLYLNGEKITDLVLPEPVAGAVYGYGGVGGYAFYNIDIETLTVPSYIKYIGYEAFNNSTVEEIIIEDGLADIGSSAFENTALKTLVLPKSVKYIGYYAFANSALEDVTFNCEEVYIYGSAFANCSLGDLDLGDNIKYVGHYAFCGNNATQIKLPASVTSVSYRAYAFSDNLVSVTIPDTITEIWNSFDGCWNLSHILYTGNQTQWDAISGGLMWSDLNATLHTNATGNEVTTSQDDTTITYYCAICDKTGVIEKDSGLRFTLNADGKGYTITGLSYLDVYELTIPAVIKDKPVTAIGAGAFANCTDLTEVYYNGTKAQWNALQIGENNAPLLDAALTFTDPCAEGHTYTDNKDTYCNVCGEYAYPGGNTLVYEDGYWHHVVDRQKVNDTTLVYFGSNWYYVKNGVVNYSNTLCSWNGKWYHVKNGTVVYDTTLVYFGSKWYYVKNGVLDYSNTLCNWNGKWYHVKNGTVVYDTTLVYFGGAWRYVKNGVLDTSNTLCNWNGKWYHVKDGVVVYDTTLVSFAGKWYYVKSGVVDFSATTLCYFGGAWRYVKNGVLNTSNTLCSWNGKWYHVNNGTVVYDTTLVYFGGTWRYVKNGVLNTSNTLCNWNGKWYHVKNGTVVYDTTLVSFAGKWYYVKSGVVNYSNTLCSFAGRWYHVNNGTVVYDTTLVYFAGNWYYVRSGVVDFTYSGSVLFRGSYYTVKNGVKV